jgi:hypothetical protein
VIYLHKDSDGVIVESLPVIVISGEATFGAALRVRIQTGISIDIPLLPGNGFDFSLGVFADIIKYEAIISSGPSCPLEIVADALIDIGAAAYFGVHIGSQSFDTFLSVLEVIFAKHFALTCLHHNSTMSTVGISTGTSSISKCGSPSPTSYGSSLLSSYDPSLISYSSPSPSYGLSSPSSHSSPSQDTTFYLSGAPTTYVVPSSASYVNHTSPETTPTPVFTLYSHPVVMPIIPTSPATLSPCATKKYTTIQSLAYYAPQVTFSHPLHSYATNVSNITTEYIPAPTTGPPVSMFPTGTYIRLSSQTYHLSGKPVASGTGAGRIAQPTFTGGSAKVVGEATLSTGFASLILGIYVMSVGF